MRVFRRVMLGGGDNFPEDWIIYYTADEKINPTGFKVLSNTFNPTLGEGKIINHGIITSFPQSCFYGTKIKTINIPNSVTTLERDCLSNTQLTEINIPDNVVTIKGAAISINDNLNRIIVGDNVELLGSQAFYKNPNLEEIRFNGKNIKEIGSYCFENNPKLKKIICSHRDFPEMLANKIEVQSAPTINGAGFYWEDKLVTSLYIKGDVNSNVYKNCKGLSYISIDNGYISSSAFEGITSEENLLVYISGSNSGVIAYKAFSESDIYELVFINVTAIEIEGSAFYNCKNLSNIVFQYAQNINFIGAFSFNGCTKLTNVQFADVYQIDDYAFSSCTAMNYYSFKNNTKVPILGGPRVFNYIPSTCKIIVPDALYDEWITATNWSAYADHIIKQSDWDASQTTE